MRPRGPCIRSRLISTVVLPVVVLVFGGTGTLLATGCGGFRKQTFNRPPAAAASRKTPETRNRSAHVVVIGHFKTPTHPLKWGSVGPGMGEAVARSLINHGNFDVWMNPTLVRRVEGLVPMAPDARVKELASIQEDFPLVQFVVMGKVTDFHHTSDVVLSAKRRGAAQAVVAIRLDVFDLRLGRLVASDHVYGAAPAPDVPSNELYAGVAFDSYLFWSTPLGEASDLAVHEVMEVLARVAEAGNGTIRIVERLDERRVRIVGGLPDQLHGDHRFYVYRSGATPEAYEPVRDRDTRMPLQARIEAGGDDDGWTAWLLGQADEKTDLLGAVLRAEPPAELLGAEPPAPPAVSAVDG